MPPDFGIAWAVSGSPTTVYDRKQQYQQTDTALKQPPFVISEMSKRGCFHDPGDLVPPFVILLSSSLRGHL